MIVVDAAPLIYLSKTGRLNLLKKLYDTVLVPKAVWNEVVTEAHGRPGASEVEKGLEEGWIKTRKVRVSKSLEAEGAEGADAEVIVLAKESDLLLLTNDRALATIARTHGVGVKWLTQAIVEAVDRRVITSKEGRALLRDLVRAGLRVRSEVLAEVVHLLEEAKKEDPVFTGPPVAPKTGKKERISEEHDKYLYGESRRSS